MILLLLACARPPTALAPYRAEVTRPVERRDVVNRAGEQCIWEAERLLIGGVTVWAATPPEGEGWCRTGFEYARTIDIVGQDGPFLSTILSELSTDGGWSHRCVTWDLRSATPTTLDAYDPRHAPGRWSALATRVGRPELAGLRFTREDFLVGPGRVRFCAVHRDQLVEVAVP